MLLRSQQILKEDVVVGEDGDRQFIPLLFKLRPQLKMQLLVRKVGCQLSLMLFPTLTVNNIMTEQILCQGQAIEPNTCISVLDVCAETI